MARNRNKRKSEVTSINNEKISVKYTDDGTIDDLYFENGKVPFEWDLIEPSQGNGINNQNNNRYNESYNNYQDQNQDQQQYDNYDNYNNYNSYNNYNNNNRYNQNNYGHGYNNNNNNNYSHGYDQNNQYYQNRGRGRGNRWQRKNVQSNQNNQNYNNYHNNSDNYNNYNDQLRDNRDNRYNKRPNQDYFQQKRQRYDQQNADRDHSQNYHNNIQEPGQHQHQQQNNNNNHNQEPKPQIQKIKRKEVPQQRVCTIQSSIFYLILNQKLLEISSHFSSQFFQSKFEIQAIVRTLSAVTNSTESGQQYQNQTHYPPAPEPKVEIDSSRLPLRGDIVEISYTGGTKNDPVRIIHTNYYGDARIRYTDSQGAEDKISLFNKNNTDISWQITNSVFDDNKDVKY